MDENKLLINDWLSQIGASKKTKELYSHALEKYSQFTSKKPVLLIESAEEEITKGVLMRKRSIRRYLLGFKNSLEEEGRSPKTINAYMAAVKSFYRTNEIDLPNLKEKAARPLEENGSRAQLTMDDVRKLINHAKNLRNKAIIYTIVSSGLGGNEVRNLKIKHIRDVDENGIATLQLTRKKVNYEFTTFLSPEALDAINDYLEIRKKTEKLNVHGPDDYVFVTENGDYIDDQTFMKIFRDLAAEAGYGNGYSNYNLVRAHNLRKFFNSQLLNNGADIFFTDFLMGHKIDGTHEAYFKSDPKKLKERYLKYLPYLTIEKTESRVLDSEAYSKLQEENTQLRLNIEKMEKRIDEMETQKTTFTEEMIRAMIENRVKEILKRTQDK